MGVRVGVYSLSRVIECQEKVGVVVGGQDVCEGGFSQAGWGLHERDGVFSGQSTRPFGPLVVWEAWVGLNPRDPVYP